MDIENIDQFVLKSLLRISIAGILLILASNLLTLPHDIISIQITSVVLFTNLVAYSLRKRYPSVSTSIVTIVVLALMAYQRLIVPGGSISLSVVVIIGFIVSILLKGKIMWIMHGLAFLILNTIFLVDVQDRFTAAISYSTLYIILSFVSGMLKFNYDRIYRRLKESNAELNDKAQEIAHQNEELLKVHNSLNSLNTNLERLVDKRTAKIQDQNKLLIKYSHANAHHLRGPVARLLGLGSIYKLDPGLKPDFVIQKMIDEAMEIDSVIRRISLELNEDVDDGK